MYYTAHYGEVHIIYIPVNLVGNMYICYVYICWSAINGLMELIKKTALQHYFVFVSLSTEYEIDVWFFFFACNFLYKKYKYMTKKIIRYFICVYGIINCKVFSSTEHLT